MAYDQATPFLQPVMKRLPALPDNPFFVRSAALLVVLAALVTAFTLYARKELRVDAINVQREQSLTLMDELRQSSQDLTKEAVRLGVEGTAVGVDCEGCPTLADLEKR